MAAADSYPALPRPAQRGGRAPTPETPTRSGESLEIRSAFLTIGVYGGASRCRARLRDGEGRAIAEAQGRAAISTSISPPRSPPSRRSRRRLRQGGPRRRRPGAVALGLGLAGLSSPADAERVEAALRRFRQRARRQRRGRRLSRRPWRRRRRLVIAGTGSAAIARVGGRETVIGGRGFLLGDDGSTARVGAEAIRAALRAHDGVGRRPR